MRVIQTSLLVLFFNVALCSFVQSGIAKGVRRIVAVTRDLATAAQERAKAFEAQLDAADKVEGLALDTEVRRGTVVPCSSSICFALV